MTCEQAEERLVELAQRHPWAFYKYTMVHWWRLSRETRGFMAAAIDILMLEEHGELGTTESGTQRESRGDV
jgi:hypothetical protein